MKKRTREEMHEFLTRPIADLSDDELSETIVLYQRMLEHAPGNLGIAEQLILAQNEALFRDGDLPEGAR